MAKSNQKPNQEMKSSKKQLSDFLDEINQKNQASKSNVKDQSNNKEPTDVSKTSALKDKKSNDLQHSLKSKDPILDFLTPTKKNQYLNNKSMLSDTNKKDLSKSQIVKNLDLLIEKNGNNNKNDILKIVSQMSDAKITEDPNPSTLIPTTNFNINKDKWNEIKSIISKNKKKQTTLMDLSDELRTKSVNSVMAKNPNSKNDVSKVGDLKSDFPIISKNKIKILKSNDRTKLDKNQSQLNILCPTQTYFKFLDYMYENSKDENETFSWMKTLSKDEFEPDLSENQIDDYLDRTIFISEYGIIDADASQFFTNNEELYLNLPELFDEDDFINENGVKINSKPTDKSQDRSGHHHTESNDIKNTKQYRENSVSKDIGINKIDSTLKHKNAPSQVDPLTFSKIKGQTEITGISVIKGNKVSINIPSDLSKNPMFNSIKNTVDLSLISKIGQANKNLKPKDSNVDKFDSNVIDYSKDKILKYSNTIKPSKVVPTEKPIDFLKTSQQKREEANSIQMNLMKINKNVHKANDITNPDISKFQSEYSLFLYIFCSSSHSYFVISGLFDFWTESVVFLFFSIVCGIKSF